MENKKQQNLRTYETPGTNIIYKKRSPKKTWLWRESKRTACRNAWLMEELVKKDITKEQGWDGWIILKTGLGLLGVRQRAYKEER